MTVSDTINAYVVWLRSLGTEFRTESQVQRSFSNAWTGSVAAMTLGLSPK